MLVNWRTHTHTHRSEQFIHIHHINCQIDTLHPASRSKEKNSNQKNENQRNAMSQSTVLRLFIFTFISGTARSNRRLNTKVDIYWERTHNGSYSTWMGAWKRDRKRHWTHFQTGRTLLLLAHSETNKMKQNSALFLRRRQTSEYILECVHTTQTHTEGKWINKMKILFKLKTKNNNKNMRTNRYREAIRRYTQYKYHNRFLVMKCYELRESEYI